MSTTTIVRRLPAAAPRSVVAEHTPPSVVAATCGGHLLDPESA